jgi:twitching motility protein PilT
MPVSAANCGRCCAEATTARLQPVAATKPATQSGAPETLSQVAQSQFFRRKAIMAQIDNFIGMMNQQNVERAVLLGDKPAHLFVGGQDKPGPIIPGAKLQQVVQEIVPPDMHAQLAAGQDVKFSYQSPNGTYQIVVHRVESGLQVGISAGEARVAAVTPDAPVSTPSVEAKTTNGAGEADGTVHVIKEVKPIQHVDELFRLMEEKSASDLHLSSNVAPMMRIQGIMRTLDEYEINTHDTLKKLLWQIAPERNQQQWETDKDTDFAYEVPGLARFRCNYFADRHGVGAVFRLIPSEILTVQQLKLPKACTDLCKLSKGLVVVTGPTGSGKSTTLAALVDYINKTRDEHIITIEDPVEFVHENINCLINQREVHVHTESFTRALRAALREDPDICLVGEMRDLETIEIALTTAETGHLVFGTLHTTTAPSTVDRIIDQFPSGQQAQIRVMLSESLKGVIAQTLLRTVDGKRVAAHEILLVPTAVANLIREGKTFQLPSQMQIGKSQGMQTMNDSILKYVIDGRVAPLEGFIKATDKVGIIQSYEANNIPINFETNLENA